MKQEEFEIDENGVLLAYHGEGGEVVIPEGITEISVTFLGMKNLTSVHLPESLKELQEHCFYGCNTLEKAHLPSHLKKIPCSAFERTGLKEITLPSFLEVIESAAFNECANLEKVDFPDSVYSIGYRAFCNTPLLNKSADDKPLIVGDGVLLWHSDKYCMFGQYITPILHLSNEVKTIAGGVFENGKFENVSFSDSLERIEDHAFSDSAVSSLRLSENLTYIGDSAFARCKNLYDVPLADCPKLKEIGNYAFSGCCYLTGVAYDYEEIVSDTNLDFWEFGYEAEEKTELNLPESLEKIGQSAFSDCTSLRKITIPSGVEVIMNQTFQNCYGLTTVVFSEGLKAIGNFAFLNCSGLVNVVIPDGLNVIFEQAFRRCTSLSLVSIPESVTKLEEGAFSYCHPSLKTVLRMKLTGKEPYPLNIKTMVEEVQNHNMNKE